MVKTLVEAVRARPFDEYQEWWSLGDEFVGFMAQSIVREWEGVHGNSSELAPIEAYVARYLAAVYDRRARPTLVQEFAEDALRMPLQSGEFDALSYAFFRHAFELIAQHEHLYTRGIVAARRVFTKHVGMLFFRRVYAHLDLDIPAFIHTRAEWRQLQHAIAQVGAFLKAQGYLRDHFAFRFDVETEYQGEAIAQSEEQFLQRLVNGQQGFALYEMGYPVILPSAVYLYNTVGEAQHHSSRTIEELFEMAGYWATETDDFDPTGFPPDRVVELWTIQPLGRNIE